MLDMGAYDSWTDVIDRIYRSKYVISESLHGLIVSEAYGIPCAWIELEPHFSNWEYKFKDFYYSIGKMQVSPISMSELDLYDRIDQSVALWRPGDIDFEELKKLFPLK